MGKRMKAQDDISSASASLGKRTFVTPNLKKDSSGSSLIKLKSKNKLIKKIRYVDEYTSNRLFQNNINENNKLSASEIDKST